MSYWKYLLSKSGPHGCHIPGKSIFNSKLFFFFCQSGLCHSVQSRARADTHCTACTLLSISGPHSTSDPLHLASHWFWLCMASIDPRLGGIEPCRYTTEINFLSYSSKSHLLHLRVLASAEEKQIKTYVFLLYMPRMGVSLPGLNSHLWNKIQSLMASCT